MPTSEDTHADGTAAAAISNGVVKVLHEYTGRGPTKARTEIHLNSVMVLMADTLTKGERSLVKDGQRELVLEMRRKFQVAMSEDLVAIVERLTERKVVAFMSENHIDPDMAAEIFVLQPINEQSLPSAPADNRRANG